jgi:hypothetical protein
MPWRTAGRGSLALIALAALVLAAVVGRIAAGDEAEARPAVPRNRASVKVEAYMAKEPGKGLPTLADVVRFYGLEEDTIECAVQENYGEAASKAAIPILARRPIRTGNEVVLCLD